MTNEEMNWFRRGGKRPEPAPKAPVCQNCGDDPAKLSEFMWKLYTPSEPATGGDPDQKTYLVKVSQVKKCLWAGYVRIAADSKLEAFAKARDKFNNGELDTWGLTDPDLGSEDGSDDEPVFSVIEPEAS